MEWVYSYNPGAHTEHQSGDEFDTDVPDDHEVSLSKQWEQLQCLEANWQRLSCRHWLPGSIGIDCQLRRDTSDTQPHQPRRGRRQHDSVTFNHRQIQALGKWGLGSRQHRGDYSRRDAVCDSECRGFGVCGCWRQMCPVVGDAVGRPNWFDDLTDLQQRRRRRYDTSKARQTSHSDIWVCNHETIRYCGYFLYQISNVVQVQLVRYWTSSPSILTAIFPGEPELSGFIRLDALA